MLETVLPPGRVALVIAVIVGTDRRKHSRRSRVAARFVYELLCNTLRHTVKGDESSTTGTHAPSSSSSSSVAYREREFDFWRLRVDGGRGEGVDETASFWND